MTDGWRGVPVVQTPQTNTVETATATPRRDFPALTGLRYVAALWVVCYHFSGHLSAVLQPRLGPLWPVVRAGWLGVDLFFVLSGFVIANAYLATMGPRFKPRDVIRFLWARFARVWPVWAVVTIGFGAFLLVMDQSQSDSNSVSVTVWHTVEQLLMVQLWSSRGILETSYVVPGWSLSAEWLAYCCFPLLALIVFRVRRLPAPVLVALSLLAMVPLAWVTWSLGDSQDRWILRIAGGFLAGMFMSMAVLRLRVTARLERLAGLATLLVLTEIILTTWWSAAQPVARSAVSILLFPLLVGSLALASNWLTRALTTPFMQLGGRTSYSLYLVHSCGLALFSALGKLSDRFASGQPLYTILLPQVMLATIVLAYPMWRWVEEPSRRWLLAHPPYKRTRRDPAVPPAQAQVPLGAEPAPEAPAPGSTVPARLS
jgi:peptidoglycan/LPS O-acetylase OafA/YrhL